MSPSFIPETPKEERQVPFFEDATAEEGWQGQSTGKSIRTLQAEIANAIVRLGGMVTSFRKGRFGERDGFQINYSMTVADEHVIYGRINIAALPIKKFNSWDRRHTPEDVRRDKSLRMALYMLRMALDGTWFLEQLSPGYAPLMPFLIGKDGQTITEAYTEGLMGNLLPSPDDFIDGEVS